MTMARSCWRFMASMILVTVSLPLQARATEAAAPPLATTGSVSDVAVAAVSPVLIEAPVGSVTIGAEGSVAGRKKYGNSTSVSGSASLITFSDRPPPVRSLAPAMNGSYSLGAVTLPLARSRLTSSFGARRHPVTGGQRLHAGVDLAAPAGTPVQAFADGVVVQAGWAGGYGLLVSVAHRDGSQTRYAHLSRIAVNVGQRVGAGQMVGLVGSTGLSTGPHLHFERRVRGFAVNPL